MTFRKEKRIPDLCFALPAKTEDQFSIGRSAREKCPNCNRHHPKAFIAKGLCRKAYSRWKKQEQKYVFRQTARGLCWALPVYAASLILMVYVFITLLTGEGLIGEQALLAVGAFVSGAVLMVPLDHRRVVKSGYKKEFRKRNPEWKRAAEIVERQIIPPTSSLESVAQ